MAREFQDSAIAWAADMGSFAADVNGRGSGVGIVELELGSLKADCRKIAQLVQLNWRSTQSPALGVSPCRILAVGKPVLRRLAPELRACGLIDFCDSPLRIGRLVALVRNCLEASVSLDPCLEQAIADNLPWS